MNADGSWLSIERLPDGSVDITDARPLFGGSHYFANPDDFVFFCNKIVEFMNEQNLNPAAPPSLSVIIQQYLRRFTPAESIDEPGVQIRTTDSILNELSDIADFEPNEIASFMLRAGYVTDYSPDGRHGWLMRRTD
jgi:hypothetical protein